MNSTNTSTSSLADAGANSNGGVFDEKDMRVTKRTGAIEVVSFDKILKRIKTLGQEAGIKINYTSLVMKVIDQLYDKISTRKIDELSAEQCASMASIHPDYNVLAGRIVVSNHHKNTDASFTAVMKTLYENTDVHGNHSPIISEELHTLVCHHGDIIDEWLDYERDYLIEYFGFKTLERAYLMKVNNKIVERPQHMWMRVALGIHGANLEKARETYDLMSRKYFTHATPTLFNAGTPRAQMSSCYLLQLEDDSIEGIYNTLKECALISKWAGGIGLHIHNVRAFGSKIRGTNGTSNGIVPMLRVFNNTAKYVDQCVHPNTIIYTTAGPMRIKDCVAGETQVLNLKGEAETIQNILEHSYTGEALSITIDNCASPLLVTPEHPIYVLRGYAGEDIELEIKNGTATFEWVDAKDLTHRDMVVYKQPKYEKDVATITEDDCFIYGILLAYGVFSKENSGSYVVQSEYGEVIEKVKEYLDEKCIQPTSITRTSIEWEKTVNLPFRHSDFFAQNGETHIGARWLNLPLNKMEHILRGIYLSKDLPLFADCIHYTGSQIAIEGVGYMLLRHKIVQKEHSYSVASEENTDISVKYNKLTLDKTELILAIYNPDAVISASDCMKRTIKYDDLMFSRVTKVSKTEYTGVLYDLQMADEHNYMLHTGIVHNGGGKRSGSFAIYLEPWHADVELFLQMRKNHGDEELKARDLFYALWMPDLFMERVKAGGKWTLMCPDECPGLSDVYGDEFVKLYESYEKAGKGKKTVEARDLWFQILDAQMETGTPYLCYKDASNQKSNQKNVGTIKSSNLCVAPETMVLTDKGHIEIYKLEGQKVNVWNGEEFSDVTVFKTGVDQDLIEVHTDDGSVLSCTPYHKFYIQLPSGIVQVEAKDLKPDDKIIQCSFPVISGDAICDLDSYTNPLHTCSIRSKVDWFSKYCDASECVSEGGDLQVYFQNKEHANKIKLFLQTCGINPKVKMSIEKHSLSTVYRLLITPNDVNKLVELGFSPKEIELDISSSNKEQPFIKILKVEYNNRIDDTYCFTEPKRHMGVFNGILTGQCTEIIEYSDPTETAVCNLASIALPTFVETGVFNFEKLHQITKVVTNNLNRVIDINFYPTPKTHKSNMRHRPIGIGVQGLSDVFMMLNLPFYCEKSVQLNKDIFETIYHGALEQSCENAGLEGPYQSFAGSPASQGILQFDMWNVTPSSRYDWSGLKEKIKTQGLRNSLLVAPMPTASTSQILGFNECIEPITSNIYSRRTLAGEFIIANKYLMNDMINLGLWNEKVKNNIILNNGSIQQLDMVPEEIRNKYKTVWEMPMRNLIDMAADRGAYICQSQSLNLWVEDPNYNRLSSMHFYAWQKGLKTGIYYLRRRGAHKAQQFTIEVENKKKVIEKSEEVCEMCSA